MKLLDLVIAQEALRRLASLELPAAASFRVARAMRPIQVELQSYERQRVALVQRMGEDTGQGQTAVSPERNEEFNAEYQALLNVEVELDITPLSPGILGDVKIQVADLMILEFLFKEENE